MSKKDTILDAIRRLPEDADYPEAIEEIRIMQCIEEGERAAEEGRVRSHDEVKSLIQMDQNPGRTPSSGEVGAELNIYGGLVGDGLRDAEQQGRGGCELQLKLRVSLRRRESRHFTLAPAKLEESETCQMDFLRRAALVSVVYGNTFYQISIPQYCESKRQ